MDRASFESNIRNASEADSSIPSFAWICIGDGYFDRLDAEHRRHAQTYLKLWESSDDEEGFVQRVLSSRELSRSQGYAVLFAFENGSTKGGKPLPAWWWDTFDVEERTRVWSDTGDIAFSHGGLSASYGFGDGGAFELIILAAGQKGLCAPLFDLAGSLDGPFDVPGAIGSLHFEGRFLVFTRRNLVVLQRMGWL